MNLTGLRARLNALAQGRFRTVLTRLESVPPLEVILLRLKPLRYPAYLLAGLLAADLIMLGVGAFFDNGKAPPPARTRIVTDAPYLRNLTAYDGIISRNAFCPGCPVPDMQIRAMERPKDCNKAPVLASDAKLIGTIVLSDSRYSVATLLDSSSESTALLVGDNFRNYGKVLEIRRNRICFLKDDNTLGVIEMPEDDIKVGQPLPTAFAPSAAEGIARTSDTSFSIKRSYLLSQLNNPSLLMDAAAVPTVLPDGAQGFKVTSITPGSVYESLGIQQNDIITKVDNAPVSIARAQELFSSVKTVSQLNIEVIRNGQPVTLTFKVN